eukprot:SAG11_NODE_10263_length_843_cov_1.231183_2_plen_105_part_00
MVVGVSCWLAAVLKRGIRPLCPVSRQYNALHSTCTNELSTSVPQCHSATVGENYQNLISAPRADIRGSDNSQQSIRASLPLELVVVLAKVVADLWKITASFCAV